MISNQPRGRRQTAIRLFAREFYESSLPDGGQGEYDPRFVVTKSVSYTHLTLPTIYSV